MGIVAIEGEATGKGGSQRQMVRYESDYMRSQQLLPGWQSALFSLQQEGMVTVVGSTHPWASPPDYPPPPLRGALSGGAGCPGGMLPPTHVDPAVSEAGVEMDG